MSSEYQRGVHASSSNWRDSQPLKFTQQQALELFDSLMPVEAEELRGLWRGREVYTGHPLEGLLTTCGWYSKRFDDGEQVFPMVFARQNGSTFCANPARMPLSVWLNSLPKPLVRLLFWCAYPYVVTRKSGARLRMMEFRGVTSACMVYDRLAVLDYFRRIDDSTLLCIMDLKDDTSGKTFFFQLCR
ncbi:MAG: DUF4334 domain-containing protein [Coriobacteriales bacterium]|nr:DUF4334 domain-containing protein [Coriobacteriales bacterium]